MKMFKKAEVEMGFAKIVIMFMVVVVGLALFVGNFAGDIGTMTRLEDSGNNQTITMPSGTPLELTMCGQLVNTIIVTNASGGEVVVAANYTTSQAAGSDGYLSAFINNATDTYAGASVNVTCNYQPRGYITDAGSRGIVSLIAILFALLIVIAVFPEKKVMDFFKGI